MKSFLKKYWQILLGGYVGGVALTYFIFTFFGQSVISDLYALPIDLVLPILSVLGLHDYWDLMVFLVIFYGTIIFLIEKWILDRKKK